VKAQDEIAAELDALLIQGNAIPWRGSGGHAFVGDSAIPDCQYWLAKAIAVLESFLPTSSFHFREAVRLAERSHRQGGIIKIDVDALLGHLRFLHEAVRDGQLRSLQNEVAAADFHEFLSHARYYLAEGKKIEASVIAAATFEDTVKRLGQLYGAEDLSKLDSTISALKSKNVVTSVEAKQLRYLAGIRNSALHASWDEFALDAVKDLIEGVERLLTQLRAAP
jgi:uncharacterized protein YutE (UPF0331/DUF86 family)